LNIRGEERRDVGGTFWKKFPQTPSKTFRLWQPESLADMMGKEEKKKLRGVRLKSVRPVDVGLV